MSIPYEDTVVYFMEDHMLVTQIHLGDSLRKKIPRVEGGILSGDSPALVSKVAKQCGLTWGKGGMDPLQKREEIMQIKKGGRAIVFVGDGVNDAPAMAACDISISLISGSDLAVAISDILLHPDSLDVLPALCHLTKKCQKIIQQNLFWAFFYNSIGIVLACFGVLTPFFAAAAMFISSLFVILNSYRL